MVIQGNQGLLRGSSEGPSGDHQRGIRGSSEGHQRDIRGHQRAISSKASTLIGGRGSSEALGGAIKRHSVRWSPLRALTTVPC